MGYSKLTAYIDISPNKNKVRKYDVTRITPHCAVCSVFVERLLSIFKPLSRQASCNYGIGKDGKIGLCVDENDRSWCSSSYDNDHRAITIEVASSNKYPYDITESSMNSLINLMADICERYNKDKIIWIPDKKKALSYELKSNEMLITVHRWFAATACPGDYIYNHLGYIADKVNELLNESIDKEDKYIKYKVQKGDTLYKISKKYNVKLNDIININNIDNPNIIFEDQLLVIPKQ